MCMFNFNVARMSGLYFRLLIGWCASTAAISGKSFLRGSSWSEAHSTAGPRQYAHGGDRPAVDGFGQHLARGPRGGQCALAAPCEFVERTARAVQRFIYAPLCVVANRKIGKFCFVTAIAATTDDGDVSFHSNTRFQVLTSHSSAGGPLIIDNRLWAAVQHELGPGGSARVGPT